MSTRGRARAELMSRLPLVGTVVVAALLSRCAAPRPPPPTLEGLAAMLGEAVGGTVAPRDLGWEPRRPALVELLIGRPILFLASPGPGKPRDLWRARVRLGLDGKPLGVTQRRNLTDTPLGDDAGLVVRGDQALFATVAYGRVQGVSVLELGGVRPGDLPQGRLERWRQAVTHFQEVGAPDGLGRTDVVLEVPAPRVRVTLRGRRVDLELGAAGEERLTLDLDRRELSAPEVAQGHRSHGARAEPQVFPPKPLILWGVDTVRHEVGPAPIAWLEEKVFGARDVVRRTTFSLGATRSDSTLKEGAEEVAATPRPLDASKLEDGGWPPPAIPSLWKEPRPGEGEWLPVDLPFLKRLPTVAPGATAPAYFYRTVIRPDPRRPYSELLLVAMDFRQLALGMQAGFEDPKPLTGPPGSGRLPKEHAPQVVATFNGAFKTTHGKYGMMVDRRVLLPAVPGAATILVEEDGEVGLGSWPATDEIPDDVVSFRQNLDPLVEDGVANPTGRNVWGWQLAGTSVMTERTALCVTDAGHLYYAWGKDIDGPTLGKALRQAGCSYGVHLDMNPKHCGFVFTDVVDLGKKQFNLQRASDEMDINADKFVRWSPKDFFYVMLRDPTPQDPSGIRWSPDRGQQPPPAFLPGIFGGRLSVGGVEVALTSFERGRVSFRVRAGSREPSVVGAPPKPLELEGEERHHALAAIGLGHATEVVRAGLAFGPRPALPQQKSLASLVARGSGALELHPPAVTPSLEEGDALAQVPLLAEDGKLLPIAVQRGPRELRGALCLAPGGRVVVALARHDASDVVTTALLRVGCRRVVALDRGSRHPAFVQRTGTDDAPLSIYPTSVLYALGRPMVPHARRWRPQGAAPRTRPTLWDVPPR